MTYFEAQQILDKIDSKTVIDSNLLDYLLVKKGLITLQALQIVTEKNWKGLLEKYEGQEISVFQTEIIENYVGKKLHFLISKEISLIISEDKNKIYYLSPSNKNIMGINKKDFNFSHYKII